MKRYCYLIAAVIMLLILVAQGCQAQTSSSVSEDDLTMVNNYLKGIGSEEITMESATDISNAFYENSNTKEKKSCWQFIYDYVKNETSAKPTSLDYSIKFNSDGTFNLNMDKSWSRIDG